jgi:creatinine amidohydrolase/Fe(II)-dependent formamide hydrolase-like protein
LGELARQLDAVWRPTGTRVLHIAAYHGDNGQADWLRRRGLSQAAIGSHAAVRDTAELLHVHPEGVRRERLPARPSLDRDGSDGEPARADGEIGARMLELKVETIVAAIEALREDGR